MSKAVTVAPTRPSTTTVMVEFNRIRNQLYADILNAMLKTDSPGYGSVDKRMKHAMDDHDIDSAMSAYLEHETEERNREAAYAQKQPNEDKSRLRGVSRLSMFER
jgi:hypothetical protein